MPQRLPANYRKPHGVRFFFGAYDVGKDQLFGHWFEHKGSAPTLSFLKWVRRRYPRDRQIHLIMDNLSAHWSKEITSWAQGANVELVPTPTYASWLNRIECHFGVMVKSVIAGSEYPDHAELQAMASAWLRRRNLEARRDFDERQQEKERRRKQRAARRKRRACVAAPPALAA